MAKIYKLTSLGWEKFKVMSYDDIFSALGVDEVYLGNYTKADLQRFLERYGFTMYGFVDPVQLVEGKKVLRLFFKKNLAHQAMSLLESKAKENRKNKSDDETDDVWEVYTRK